MVNDNGKACLADTRCEVVAAMSFYSFGCCCDPLPLNVRFGELAPRYPYEPLSQRDNRKGLGYATLLFHNNILRVFFEQ